MPRGPLCQRSTGRRVGTVLPALGRSRAAFWDGRRNSGWTLGLPAVWPGASGFVTVNGSDVVAEVFPAPSIWSTWKLYAPSARLAIDTEFSRESLGPITTAPPAPMICQRAYAPGSMAHPKVMMPEAGNGGLTVMVGAAGGVVSTTNACVACAPGWPKGVSWLTRKVYAPSASDGNVHSFCGPL